jgi:aldehyde:ferredoxin oxidoreductase
MTGGVGSANSCGHFAPELKFAGYDHIVFQGRSRRPVYLWINDDQVEILDASHIWGRTTWQTDDLIKEDLGNEEIQIACIGPAGENLVRSACIITNRARSASRCGLGAVMGSKNLKAVAVRGSDSIEVAYPERFMEAVDKAWEKLKASGAANKELNPHRFNKAGIMPVRNFQDAYMSPDKLDKLMPQVYEENCEIRRLGYFACPIHCSRLYKVRGGQYAGLVSEGLHANDLLNWVGRFDLDLDDPAVMIKLHALCNEYGLDQDNASCSIAWAFECYQRGIFTQKDTDGLKLEWGDYQVVAELLRKVAYREGLGDLLAEGSKRASQIVGKGSDGFAIHVKGQDSMEPMRTSKGWALGCGVSTRGGTHTRGAAFIEMTGDIPLEICEKIWGVQVEGPLSYENKAKLVVYYERLQAVLDSLGVCLFSSNYNGPDLLGPDDLAELYSAATGIEMDEDGLMRMGERIHNIEKAFNILHAGFSRRDDDPPQRLMDEPVESGPMKGERLDREKWDQMLDEYYELHGWDKETGWQTRKCLEDLDLQKVADHLEKVERVSA